MSSDDIKDDVTGRNDVIGKEGQQLRYTVYLDSSEIITGIMLTVGLLLTGLYT